VSISVFAQKIMDRFAVYLCDSLQLDDVQPSFSKFAFRDERMRLAKALGDLALQITGVVSRFYQAFQECLVRSLVCCIALVHRLRLLDC
jgi:hypothetical protein